MHPFERLFFQNYNAGQPGVGEAPRITKVTWSNLSFGVLALPTELVTETLPGGQAGEAYEATLEVDSETDWATSVTDGALPDGLTLSADGVLSGTPTSAGSYTFTVLADNGAEAQESTTSQREFTVVIEKAEVPVTPTPTPTPPVNPIPTPTPPLNHSLPYIYTTPGQHTYNGRGWSTTCEPYSQTERCRTDIIATIVSYQNGKFVQKTDWTFNNLTYLPSPRSLWTRNPLGYANAWVTDEGRRWRTECDTPNTGIGACRSYIWTQVVEASPRAEGGYTYQQKYAYMFNNIVLFTR